MLPVQTRSRIEYYSGFHKARYCLDLSWKCRDGGVHQDFGGCVFAQVAAALPSSQQDATQSFTGKQKAIGETKNNLTRGVPRERDAFSISRQKLFLEAVGKYAKGLSGQSWKGGEEEGVSPGVAGSFSMINDHWPSRGVPQDV